MIEQYRAPDTPIPHSMLCMYRDRSFAATNSLNEEGTLEGKGTTGHGTDRVAAIASGPDVLAAVADSFPRVSHRPVAADSAPEAVDKPATTH
ncbi:hypothetical protein J6590_041167 [Homalodisca vitripennis]|nr:hypothetical protein J6590_041167 [Homalodisca vitripennis]